MTITSESGKQMITYVSPIYRNSRVMRAIFQANGKEIDLTKRNYEEIKLQLFPQTATWGLRFWEESAGIEVNESLPIEQRRRAVISKLATRFPITKNRFRRIVSSLSNAKVDIEFIADGHFITWLSNDDEKLIDLMRVPERVEEIKPAHLIYDLGVLHSRTFEVASSDRVPVYELPYTNRIFTGQHPDKAHLGRIHDSLLEFISKSYESERNYKLGGFSLTGIDKVNPNLTKYKSVTLNVDSLGRASSYRHILSGKLITGELWNFGRAFDRTLETRSYRYDVKRKYKICGVAYSSEEVSA